MGGVLIVVVLILLAIGGIFIKTKINNLKYRAKQQMLGTVGLSNANINANFNQMQENKALEKFLGEYPNYTEKIIKDTFYSFALNIINVQNNGYMSEKVLNKMSKDNMLNVFRTLSFTRINILGYKNDQFYVVVVFSNERDEYQITMNISMQNNLFYIDSYDSMRGMVKGV